MLNRFVRLLCPLGALIVGAKLAVAGPLNYNTKDLMLCFRKASGSFDLEVNLGPASTYYGATPGATFTVTNFTAGQLTSAFGSAYANVSWSVCGAANLAGDPNAPKNTLWLTSGRGINSADINTQTTPWNTGSLSSQGNTVAPVLTVGNNAATYSSSVSAGANNTVTAVVVPDGNAQSYHSFIGDNGDFGTFQGNIENTTPTPFSGNSVSRSDLYQLNPNGVPKYLGYFELSANGTMTFTAAGGAAPLPIISIADTSVQIATNGTSNAVFTVTLSASSSSTVTVSYNTQDGTAAAGTDYTTTTGTITFNAGVTTQTITVPALGRTTYKNSVTFTVTLSNPVNGTLGTSLATGTIRDAFLPLVSATSVTLANQNATVTFPSSAGVSYLLRYTNAAGLRAPFSTWPVAGNSVIGNGSVLTLSDNSTDPNRFYVLQATRVP